MTGVLCDGSHEGMRPSGTAVTGDLSQRQLVRNFDQVRDRLCQSLYPGTNDPLKWRQD